MNTINKMKLILFLFTFITNDLAAQNNNLFYKADSLFELKKYVDAKNLYENFFFEKEIYSNSMLLKMAFIEEGLENYDKALIFLSYHYNETFDDETLEKIISIAEKNELLGFEQNDITYFKNYYKKNKSSINSILILLLILYFIFGVYKTSQNFVPFILFFLIVLLILNQNILKIEGIISKDKTFIMNGPSPGSDIYDIINKGSKVIISNDNSIWYEINIDGGKKYIRKKNVMLIKN